MLTARELAHVPLLAGVPVADLESLARTSADIHLEAGDYAVHEGDERALYIVLSGQLEVVRLVDGLPTVLGKRQPGEFHGEVPITLGTPFLGGARATQPTRVLRVDPRQYHALAAASPQVAETVAAKARERMGGLQGLAAKPPRARAVLCS